MWSHAPLAVHVAHAFSTRVSYLFLLETTRISLNITLRLLIVSLRRFGRIRPIVIPAGANVRIDKHLVLDARGTASNGLENCHKITAKSNILFLSVATAPIVYSLGMFMGFYKLMSLISLSTGRLLRTSGYTYTRMNAPGWNDNNFTLK